MILMHCFLVGVTVDFRIENKLEMPSLLAYTP